MIHISILDALSNLNKENNASINTILTQFSDCTYVYSPRGELQQRFPLFQEAIKSLNDNQALRNILIDILTNPDFCQINQVLYFDIEQNYLNNIRKNVIALTDNMQAEYVLLAHTVISIRVFYERKRAGYRTPLLHASFEEAYQDFQDLKSFNIEGYDRFNLPRPEAPALGTTAINQLLCRQEFSPADLTVAISKPHKSPEHLGKRASNFFIESQRIKCSQFATLSLEELLSSYRMMGKIILRLNQNYNNPSKKLGLDFLKQLHKDFVPTQWKPIFLRYLAALASKSTGSTKISFLNLCGGWGERLIGAMAAEEIDRIIETDPNRELIDYKLEMVKQYSEKDDSNIYVDGVLDPNIGVSGPMKKPINKLFYFYGLPAEDLTDLQLTPNNRKHELVLICPPYFDTELYHGDITKQSHSRYSNINRWIEEFLFVLINRSFYALSEYGLLAIHIGKSGATSHLDTSVQSEYGELAIENKKYNLPYILDKYIASLEQFFMFKYQISYARATERAECSYVKIYQKRYFPRLEYLFSSSKDDEDASKAIYLNNVYKYVKFLTKVGRKRSFDDAMGTNDYTIVPHI